MSFLALRAGLEVEWASVEKPLRTALKKYVSRDCGGDQEMNEVQIAEDESVDRYILLGIHVTLYLIISFSLVSSGMKSLVLEKVRIIVCQFSFTSYWIFRISHTVVF